MIKKNLCIRKLLANVQTGEIITQKYCSPIYFLLRLITTNNSVEGN